MNIAATIADHIEQIDEKRKIVEHFLAELSQAHTEINQIKAKAHEAVDSHEGNLKETLRNIKDELKSLKNLRKQVDGT